MIVISSTFTVEPIETFLHPLLKLSSKEIFSEIKFAPYNQLVQELLSPYSLFGKNKHGVNVILFRYSDYIKYKMPADKHVGISNFHEEIEHDVDILLDSIHKFTNSAESQLILAVCPDMPADMDAVQNAEFYVRMERKLQISLGSLKNAYLLLSKDIQTLYPVQDYADPIANEMGHIPYTNTFFSALALTLARKIYGFSSLPYKVIVLDCDNTLWKGVCGEVGPEGIEIDPARQFLQQFMVEQMQAGKLLCLCSKNVEEDVWTVFQRRHSDMPLKKEHIAAYAINWNNKSENILRLAEKLNLGLDSFIFIDDNPIECAEVIKYCPQALTIQLPQVDDEIIPLLKNIWAFDQSRAVTEEDKKRTQLYRQNFMRAELKKTSVDLNTYIKELKMEIQIQKIRPEQISRVADLTIRTNQFNFSTIRLNEKQLEKFLTEKNKGCLAVNIKDRFGDYGLVGAIFFEIKERVLEIINLMLSCRVLGRGVEHYMVSQLGELAEKEKVEMLHLNFMPSAKNKPASDFIKSIATEFNKVENGFVYTIPTGQAKICSYANTENMNSNETFDEHPTQNHIVSESKYQWGGLGIIEIAKNFQTPMQLLTHLSSRHSGYENQTYFTASIDEEEAQLIKLLGKALFKQPIGSHHNLSELGVNSLQTVMIVSQIRKQLNVPITMLDFLQLNTVHDLALQIKRYRKIESNVHERTSETNLVSRFMELVKNGKDFVKIVDERYGVSYEIFRPEHVEEAAILVAKVFADPVRGETMMKHLKCEYEEIHVIFKPFCAMAPDLGVSIIAKDMNGKIIGMTTAFDFTAPNPELDEAVLVKFAPIFAVVDAVESHLPAYLHDQKGFCLHQFLLAVEPGAPQNVAFIMNKLELEMAKYKKYQVSVSEPTGPISQPLLAELGYHVVYTLPYETFEYEGKRVFAGIKDTYTSNLPKDLLPEQMKLEGCQILMMPLNPTQSDALSSKREIEESKQTQLLMNKRDKVSAKVLSEQKAAYKGTMGNDNAHAHAHVESLDDKQEQLFQN